MSQSRKVLACRKVLSIRLNNSATEHLCFR